MKKVIVDISNKGNMLNKLVDSLDGALPYMTSSEQKDYDDYGKEIKKDYNNFIAKNKEYVANENQDIII